VKHWIAAVLKQKCARMHQILFQFPFFSGGCTPDSRHWGLCPQTPGKGARGGREGKGGKGKGRERERGGEGKGKEGEGKGRGSLRHCRWGIDDPALMDVNTLLS